MTIDNLAKSLDDLAKSVEYLTLCVHIEFVITFIVGTSLGAFGLYYAIQAFKEAKLAKEAATRAGNVVKTQEIVMELERISNSCQFSQNISFAEANVKVNEITARVYGILGIYKSDVEIKEHASLIETNISKIVESLDSANPSNPQSVVNTLNVQANLLNNYVYNITAPHVTTLIMSLNTLKGFLNNRLING